MSEAVRREVLSSGARVLVAESQGAPSVALGLWVGSGADDDPDGLPGLAHFLEHMLFRGGRAARVANSAGRAGRDLGAAAETGRDYTVFHAVVPREDWRGAMATQAGVLRARRFRAADVQAEREVVREEGAAADADPWAFVSRRVMEALFPSRRPVVGTADGISSIRGSHLVAFQTDHYVARNVVQVVVGDVCGDDVLEAARPLGDLPGRQPPPRRRVRARESGVSMRFEGALSSEYVCVGYALPGAFHPDIPATDALACLVREGQACLVGRRPSDSVSAVAGVSAILAAGLDRSVLAIRAAAPPGASAALVRRITAGVGGLARWPPPASEMERLARRGEVARAVERVTVAKAAWRLGACEALGVGWPRRDLVAMRGPSADDVARVAERYLRPEMAAVVTYGPLS